MMLEFAKVIVLHIYVQENPIVMFLLGYIVSINYQIYHIWVMVLIHVSELIISRWITNVAVFWLFKYGGHDKISLEYP